MAKWGVVLEVTFCGFRRGRQDSEKTLGGGQLGALGPLILNPTDCHRRQDTGYKIQHAAITYKHTGVEGYEDARVQRYIRCRMQDRSYSSQPGGPQVRSLHDTGQKRAHRGIRKTGNRGPRVIGRTAKRIADAGNEGVHGGQLVKKWSCHP